MPYNESLQFKIGLLRTLITCHISEVLEILISYESYSKHSKFKLAQNTLGAKISVFLPLGGCRHGTNLYSTAAIMTRDIHSNFDFRQNGRNSFKMATFKFSHLFWSNFVQFGRNSIHGWFFCADSSEIRPIWIHFNQFYCKFDQKWWSNLNCAYSTIFK
jgi:hypothetical protein